MDIKPVIPMEPRMSDEVPGGEDWIVQIKWDGVRVLTYFDGSEVRLFNRKKHERTQHFPELTDIKAYCSASSVILDGEVIALDQFGKPSFHEVMRRDGIRRMHRVPQVQKLVPISYMIFDVLYLDNEWLNKQPLSERLALLEEVIQPNNNIQMVSSHHNGQELFQIIQENDMEGIVAKNLNSPYLFGQKKEWVKIKNYKDLIAVIGGVTMRDGIVNALLLGTYNEDGQLVYIGHAGTGKLKVSEWRALSEKVKPMIMKERPFINKPERVKGAIWIKPQLAVRVQFMEWTKGRTLRQPSIQAFVDPPDKS